MTFLLTAYCILVIFLVAFAMHREGLFNAVLTTVNVLLAGILTFEFWEPLANLLDEKFQEGSLARLEDAIVMVSLFAVFLIALRWTSNSLSPTAIELEPNLDLYGGAAVGIFAGYLLAGFLVCVMETLPWKANFLGFTPHSTDDKARRYFPPDGVWLDLMQWAGTKSLSWKPVDPEKISFNTFEQRYLLYRRYTEEDGQQVPPPINKRE